MLLYNASTSYGLRNFVRKWTKTNTTTYSDADLNAAINRYYELFFSDIINSMDGWDFSGENLATNLVASQQEYVLTNANLLKIKRAEISYDGTNWYKLEFFDINERSKATDSTSISQDFDKTKPFADLYDNSLFIYPVPDANVTGGLKIWVEQNATLLSADTDEPEIAKPFHIGLAHGASMDYFSENIEKEGSVSKLNYHSNELQMIRDKMTEHYQKKVQDRPYNMTPNFVDYEYGY